MIQKQHSFFNYSITKDGMLFSLFISLPIKILNARKISNLPQGILGWPLIGETLEFLHSGEDGEPQRVMREGTSKH